MRYAGWYFMAVCLCISFSVSAVTGSSPSAITPLETVSPALQAVTATGEKNLSATFSEPMLAPGVTAPGTYAVLGLGTGTLLSSPTGVSGGPVTVALAWASGEMRNGVSLTLTASGVRDALGNPIHPAANSASCNGLGTAPVFSDLTVMPPEAAAGDTVTISFTASETLQADPEVTVNGHPATASYGKADGYSYEYEVSEDDPLGMAQMEISGADLAGNLGTLSDNDALEMIKDVEGLALPGWPWVAALLLALGMLFLARRRFIVEAPSQALYEKMGLFPPHTSKSLNGSLYRDTLSALQKTNPARGGNCPSFFGPDADARKKFGTASGAVQSLVQWLKRLRAPVAVPFFALLFACSSAFADAPVVSNVVLTQSPSATSTQVDIYYDLVAPNGPCAITVTLSKDGGADGYIHPVTTITGDLANVTTGTGKHIVWDLRADYPEEDLPNARILVTADDGAVLVQYYRDEDNDGWGSEYSYLSGICWDFVWAVTPVYPYTATQCGDCNDSAPDIYPGAPELCNGIDDDCDGAMDEVFDRHTDPLNCGSCGNVCPSGVCSGGTCVPLVEYFRDDDNDTWGVDGDSVWAVGPVAPYTATRGEDCDDTDPNINPGRSEVCCNGKDDDCDGTTDNATTCTFTATYLAGTGGSISGTTPQALNCAMGTEVTAVPDTGYHFVNWSDGSTQNPRSDGNLTADLTVTANFALNTYTLTYLAGANGSISGTTPQTVNHGSNGTQVTAVPNGGYYFSQWSDGVLTAARTDTNITADLTVTASFATCNVNSFAINSGAATTTNPVVTLNNTCVGAPTQYMASESPTFSGASWLAYGAAPSFTLSAGEGGMKTVYFKVKNASGESGVVSDTINLVERTILLPGSVPLVLRWISSGSYQMGRYPGEVDSYSNEDPQHPVTLAYGFWMGKYEITQQQWLAVRGSWPGTAPSATYGLGNTYPAYYISWDDTKNFITSLNAHIVSSGQGPLTVRLPSEAEWEYACRAGTQTRFYWGDDSGYTQIGAYAWYTGNNSPNGTKPVGGKTGNAFGLYDMSGNVYEWCEDDYHSSYTGAPTNGSAWVDSPRASGRTIRGGCWNRYARYCRSAFRNYGTPDIRSNYFGFRLAAVQ